MSITTASAAHATSISADDLWVTRLFADSALASPDPQAAISPAAAYQDALYERATLVDLRPGAVRDRQGIPADPVAARPLDPAALSGYADLVRLAESSPVILLSADGSHAERIAAHLRSLGLGEVTALRGGFTAWSELFPHSPSTAGADLAA